MPFLFGQMLVEIPWKDENIFGYHRIIYVVTIRIYLVVIDIRIVDCYMYPGEPCPPKSCTLIYTGQDLNAIQSTTLHASILPTWYHEIRVTRS